MVPLGLLGKIFSSDSNDVAPEHRAQRKLNELRIPEIRDYILENRETYVFSALAASVDGNMSFVKSCDDSNIGVLEIDMDASFLINDGQHRKAAIEAAISEDETLKNETISIVIYQDQGLVASQQMFTDLNKHAVTTSKSLNTLYESKDNLSKFSSKIFTLNTFYTANKRIVKIIGDDANAETLILNFWNNVVINMREWNEMDKGELSKKSLREDYITTQGLIILALGRLCEFFCQHPEIDINIALTGLKTIDWLRNNEECWMNRAIKPNGKINRNEQGIFLTYVQIKRLLSLPISGEEEKKEMVKKG